MKKNGIFVSNHTLQESCPTESSSNNGYYGISQAEKGQEVSNYNEVTNQKIVGFRSMNKFIIKQNHLYFIRNIIFSAFVFSPVISCVKTDTSSLNVGEGQDAHDDDIYQKFRRRSFNYNFLFKGMNAGEQRSKSDDDFMVTLTRYKNDTTKLSIKNLKDDNLGADFTFGVWTPPLFSVNWHQKNRPQTNVEYDNTKDKGKRKEILDVAKLLVKSVKIIALPEYTKLVSDFVSSIKVSENEAKLKDDLRIDSELFEFTREIYTGIDSELSNKPCEVVVDKGAKGDIFRVKINSTEDNKQSTSSYLFHLIPLGFPNDIKREKEACFEMDFNSPWNKPKNDSKPMIVKLFWEDEEGEGPYTFYTTSRTKISFCNKGAQISKQLKNVITVPLYIRTDCRIETLKISCQNLELSKSIKLKRPEN